MYAESFRRTPRPNDCPTVLDLFRTVKAFTTVVHCVRVKCVGADVDRMNPQTQQEARRILTVMDELLEDLAIVAHLPPYMSSMPDADMRHLVDSFHDEDGGQEVQQQLTEHYDLERRLESASGDMSADDVEDLHFSTRSLVDTMRFSGYPDKYRPAHPASANITNFRGIIETLRGLLRDRLNSTVEDDVMKFTILHDTVNREKNASADVQALTREYAQEKESRKVEVDRRDNTIRKLIEELKDVQHSDDQARKKLQQDLERTQEGNTQEDQDRLEELAKKVESLEEGYRNTQKKCVGEETASREARTKNERTLAAKIDKYDKDMREGTAAVEQLQAEIDEMSEALDKVNQEVTKLEEGRLSYEAEETLDRQRASHSNQMANVRKECATIIQSLFRAHWLRLQMASKGKKKGKKK
jgi:uncharacterized protein YoxC